MRRLFTEDLPLHDSGANKGKIDWKGAIGKDIGFIYDETNGHITILDKVNDTAKICYEGNEYNIKVQKLVKGQLGGMLFKKISYEDVLTAIEKFVNENKRFPLVQDMSECEYLPSHSTIKLICKEKGMTINDLALKFGFNRNDRDPSNYLHYLNKYKDICKSIGRKLNSREHNLHDLPDARWFISHCPDDNVNTYNDFVEWAGFKCKSPSKDKAIKIIYEMQSKLNRPLIYDDFRDVKGATIGIGIVNKYWGSLNKMKEALGLEIVQEDMVGKSKSKEEMLDDLICYINKYNKIPQSNDFGKNGLMSSASYHKIFGGINAAIELTGNTPIKQQEAKNMTNDEIIGVYSKLFKDNGGAMAFDYCSRIKGIPNTSTVLRRFNCKWNDFIKMLGYDIIDVPLGHRCYANDGTLCLSKSECAIHNVLLRLGLDNIEKEVLYSDFCDGYDGYMRCDWIVEKGGNRYIIEYFGLMQIGSYKASHNEKLRLIKENNLESNFVALYQKDLGKIKEVLINKIN